MSISITDVELLEDLAKAGPFIGPRGGKWADAKHTIPYSEGGKPSSSGKLLKVKTWKKRTDAGGEVFSVKIKPGGMFESFNISRSSNESLLTVKMSDGSLHNKRFKRDTMDDNKLPFALADKLLSGKVHPKEEGLKEIQSPGTKKSIFIQDIEELELLAKAGPFIGPKGGKWADAKHTIPWKDQGSKPKSGMAGSSKGTIAIAAAMKKVGFKIAKEKVEKKGNMIVKMPLRDDKGGVLVMGADPSGKIAMLGDKQSIATAQMRLASVGISAKPHDSKAVKESGMSGVVISPGKDGTFNWNEAAFQSDPTTDYIDKLMAEKYSTGPFVPPEKQAPKVIPQVPAMEGMSPLGLGTQTSKYTEGIGISAIPTNAPAAFTIGGAESTYDSAPKFEEHPDAPKDKSVQTFATYAEAADLTPAKVKKAGPDAILKYVQGMTAINAHRTEAKPDAPVRHMAATVGPNSRVFLGAAGGKDDAVQLSGPGQTQTVPRSEVKPGDVYFITGVTPGRHEMHVVVGAPHKTKIGSSDWHSNPAAKIASTYSSGGMFGKKGMRVIEYRNKDGMIADSKNRFSKFSKSVSVKDVEMLEALAKGAAKKDELSEKISKLVKEGYPQKQAVAIAHKMLGISKGDESVNSDSNGEEAYSEDPRNPGKVYEKLLKEEEK